MTPRALIGRALLWFVDAALRESAEEIRAARRREAQVETARLMARQGADPFRPGAARGPPRHDAAGS